MNSLIICPQAGMCNRFRSLASCLYISEQLNRIPLIIWDILPQNELTISGPQDYMRMTNRKFEDFFEQTLNHANEENIPNLILSEWLETDNWYRTQSYGQRKYKNISIEKIEKILPNINKYNCVLIETSLKINQYINLNGELENITDNNIYEMYKKYFIPHEKYIKILDKINDIDIGFSLRRGEFLHYYPETKYLYALGNMALNLYIDEKTNNKKSILILSDDISYSHNKINELQKRYIDKIIFNPMNEEYEICNCLVWERPFIEFLILSFKCNIIYGTNKSSYAEEAGIFGGKFHYNILMS